MALEDSFASTLQINEELYLKEPTPPKNWPASLTYLTTIVWDDTVPVDKKAKYYDQYEATVSNFCEARRDDNNEVYLVSLYKLNRFSFLGEYVGYVERDSSDLLKNKRLCFPYFRFSDTGKTYYLNTREGGNETRFMRWSDDLEKANARIQRMWLDGVVKFFVEMIQEIEAGDEIISLNSNSVHFWDFEESKGDEDFINTQTTYMQFSEMLWEKIDKEEEKALRTRKTLQELVEIKKIETEGHPCKGQFGLFAVTELKAGSFLGEYTGRVLVNLEDVMTSKYLVDYSNPFEEDCDRVWVDAKNEGNELRFINDFKGTGQDENITFKRVWVGGMMRVCGQITKDVHEGQELLTDYGEGYWNNLPTEEEEQQES